ncbi:predicted protein [Sclerotinia sclerotiorum 1980 UF-70]|uniref:Uncharacterized protein n=1 Tax=Sclerotinia sclerotiorum (strain ATCC 18683 / 1980 / Ss-1) TaxID=665079 RepID=A7EPX0_SCLS1|nr:predicted protein [Sclerotinia sclerotiorum 1980 UF-70]EDO04886.1 predicted protein [Sclerotinia sclerotiorum 1980 UF-70]
MYVLLMCGRSIAKGGTDVIDGVGSGMDSLKILIGFPIKREEGLALNFFEVKLRIFLCFLVYE